MPDNDAVVVRAESASLAWQARIAGLCYLIVIVGGVFAEQFVREPLVVEGDAAATVGEIAANEQLWLWGLTIHLLYLPAAAVVAVILYGIFKPVQAMLARLAVVFSLANVTIEAINLLHLYVPIAMVDEAAALAALDEEQKQALAYLSVRLFSTGWSFALLVFAGFCVFTGVLILRSQLVPRAIGAMMIAAGVCYVVNSLAWIHSSALSEALVPWILLPPFLGELSLALWLVVKGVRAVQPDVAC